MGTLGRPSWPKFGPKWVSNCDFSQKMTFQKNERHGGHSTILRSKSAQDRPKMSPRGSQEGVKNQLGQVSFFVTFRLRFLSVLGPFLVPFWLPFGSFLGPFGEPKSVKIRTEIGRSPQESPRGPKRHPRCPKRHPKATQEHPKGTQEEPRRHPRAPKRHRRAPKRQ